MILTQMVSSAKCGLPRRKGRYGHADTMRVSDKFILEDALR
ncbi:MAG: hypothetical protein ACRDTX_18930 [Pseudonocardiaceae bacterium]